MANLLFRGGRRVALAAQAAATAPVQLGGQAGAVLDPPPSDAPGVELTVLEGIELVTVGTDWPGLTGRTVITEENVRDAAKAASHPLVTAPRFKLGHETPTEVFADFEPAFGRYANLRVSDDGQTLLGDLVDVPAWFAAAAPSAYPGRSIEGRFGVQVGGERYSFVVDAVSCLGVRLPACSSLADLAAALPSWYGSEAPEGVKLGAAPSPSTSSPRGGSAGLSVDVGAIEREFYQQVCKGDRWDWWIRSTRVDPLQIIAEAGPGDLYQVDVTVSGNEVEFGEPTEVVEQYVAASAAPPRDRRPRALTAYTSREQSRATIEQEVRVDWQLVRALLGRPDTTTEEELRTALGVAADASDDDVRSAITRHVATSPAAASQPGTQAGSSADPSQAASGQQAAAGGTLAPSLAALQTQLAAGEVVIFDKSAAARLTAAADKVDALEERERTKTRDDALLAHVRRGAITRARAFGDGSKDEQGRARLGHYQERWNSDPEGTAAMLAQFPDSSAMPVGAPLGAEGDGSETDDSYDPRFLNNSEKAHLAAVQARLAGGNAGVVFSGDGLAIQGS